VLKLPVGVSMYKHNSKLVSLTGDRPTGHLHLGHLVGSLRKRVEFQETYNQFIMIADTQGISSSLNPDLVAVNIKQIMTDYLSVGLVPEKNTFFVQSTIPSLCEITSYYLNLVTLSRLQRNPTIKQESAEKGYEESMPMGFLCHPISQAADITAFQTDVVPAGEDQKPLIEQSNEIVDKFCNLYGDGVIKRVEIIYGNTARLLGIDGQAKASKSLNNAIFLTDPPEVVKSKVYSMYTDPNHIRVSDPGQVEGNMVFHYLDAFYDNYAELEQLKADYRKGGLGDTSVKAILYQVLEEVLEPIRERRQNITNFVIDEILHLHWYKANSIASQTLSNIRSAIGIYSLNTN